MRIKSLDGTDKVILILVCSLIYMPKTTHRLGENVFYPSFKSKKHENYLGYNDECHVPSMRDVQKSAVM